MKKLGLLTIGQAPRVDFVPEIKTVLGEDVEIIEKGALDGLTLKEVEAFYPGENDEVLVTRMADGTEVKVAEREIFPRLKNQVKNLELEGINTIFLACTGEFPPLLIPLLLSSDLRKYCTTW
jgi:protein AroM